MTTEQITELRETLRAEFLPVWGTADGRVVTWTTTQDVSKRVALALNALPKLLDEREALLEAVSNVADSILLYEKTPDEVVTGAMLADLGRILRAVRTKAGSP